VLIFKQVPG